MAVLIFSVLLLAVIFAWLGQRRRTIHSFVVTLLLAIVWFSQHLSNDNLQF